ncbi:MAG: rhomboid family intramembrane serine protease [Bacilli bacterium]|nr:rhomboid family intramembrane serine protease [Bacilli bacterium]
MKDVILNESDELVMKLLHYFITEEAYTPIVLHGVQNEIWLENLEEEYKVVRIVSNYIHNDEQFQYDLFKTNHVLKKIKKKTFTFGLQTLSIFVNLGDNVNAIKEQTDFGKVSCIEINTIEELEKNTFLSKYFPKVKEESDFKEKGLELFMKLTGDINKKSEEEATRNENVFAKKTPVVTYVLLAINALIFLLARMDSSIVNDLLLISKEHIGTDYYRLFTGFFLHYNLWHFLCNAYALYIIGSQLESFLGRGRYLFVYLVSGFTGSLLSMTFMGDNGASLGASGAVFGLLGSLLYFGYYYRVYLGTVVKSQIVPLILLNLVIGFMIPGIDNGAHIGGLIGGVLGTIAVGIKYKSTTFEKINGMIVLGLYTAFLLFLAFVGL